MLDSTSHDPQYPGSQKHTTRRPFRDTSAISFPLKSISGMCFIQFITELPVR